MTILYVLKALKKASDKNNPISQLTIMKALNKIGIKCDRRTISRDIDCLIDFGYHITKNKGGGCYLDNPFDDEDLFTIVDCINTSKLNYERKLDLIKKFYDL